MGVALRTLQSKHPRHVTVAGHYYRYYTRVAMYSHSPPDKSSLITVETTAAGVGSIRGYSDPHIFRNDRVLRMLLKREVRMTNTTTKNYFTFQTELKPHVRREVASWMLEVCEEEGSSPQVFCLAINYLDRFLSNCKISKNQLQLVGAVCLLVSWKVREHSPITAQRLIEYTDFNISLEDLLEWEFLLLSKLDWDLSLVIAPDYVEHILQRLLTLDMAWDIDVTRRKAETLIQLCYSHSGLSPWSASLIAVSCIMTTLRPSIESLIPVRDTPSPSSSSSSGSTTSSPSSVKHDSALDKVIDSLRKVTLTERSMVLECMETLEQLMQSSLPPSPAASDEESSPSLPPSSSLVSSSPLLLPAPGALFSDKSLLTPADDPPLL